MSGRARLIDPVAPLTVLYDGQCPFCRWTVATLRRWDRHGHLRLRPYQETRAQPVLAELVRGRSLGAKLHVVDAAGRVAFGGESVLAISALLPGGAPIARLVGAWPGSAAVLAAGYRAMELIRPVLSRRFNGPMLRERNPAVDR